MATLLLGGCSTPLQEYVCERAEDCDGDSRGRCEPSGHCSFPDADCQDGFRFGDNSGAESGLCVGAVPDVADAAIPDAAPNAPDASETNWLRRHRLTIDNSAHAEDLSLFPLLVVLTPERVDYSLIQDSGQDLRFTSEAGDLLPHEIELWNSSGNSYVWVRVNKLEASNANNSISMYYNNAQVPDGQDSRAVWSNGYEAVYHLSESGNSFTNSAAAINNANNAGTTTTGGVMGGARLFDGQSAHIRLNDLAPMNMLQGVSGMTITSWIRPDDLGAGDPYQGIVSIAVGDSVCTTLSRATVVLDGDQLRMVGRSLDSDGAHPRDTSTVNLNESAWYLVSALFDVDLLHNDSGQAPYGVISTVVNDTVHAVDRTARFASPTTAITQSSCGTIGAQDNGNGYHFTGVIDEVRISGVDRSTIWLQAQYQSMQDSGFVSFGAVESVDTNLSQ